MASCLLYGPTMPNSTAERRVMTLLLSGAALVLAAGLVAGASFAADVTLLNVSYDPTRELWRDINSHFVAQYEKTDRGRSDHQAVARRLQHAGARGHRRPRGRRRDARVVIDTDAIAQRGLISRRLGEAPPEPLAALLLDDRLRRPQGQPEGHQGLAGSRQAGRRDHHAQPEDVGQRLPDLLQRLGLGRPARRLARGRASTT